MPDNKEPAADHPTHSRESTSVELLDVREPLTLAKLIVQDFTTYLGSVVLAIAAVVAVWAGLGGVTEVNIRIWLTIAVATAPPVVVYLIVTRPKQNKARRLRDLAQQSDAKSEYFRLTLWENGNYTQFQRADGIHREIYDWLTTKGCQDGVPVLFVDGLSGTGKSSLLVNYVLPRAEAESGCCAITIRAALNPERQIIHKLKTLWKSAPTTSDQWSMREWFEKASKRDESPPTFLLLIDQGEELLFLDEANSPHPLLVFVRQHSENPVDGLLVVISVRTEYLHLFEKRGLLTSREQRSTIPAFDEGAAQEFVAQGLENRNAAIQLVQVGSEMDGLAGLVRPITLNLLGSIYRRDSELRVDISEARADNVRVFERFMQRRIQAGDMRELGPAVVRQLVTRAGRRAAPIAESTIQERLSCDRAALSSCLDALAADGFVRNLSSTWELAHEFLGTSINVVLQRLENRLWHKTRPYLLGSLAVVWLATLGIAIPLYGQLQEAKNRAHFLEHFAETPTTKGDWIEVTLRTAQPSDPAVAYLIKKLKVGLHIDNPSHVHADWVPLLSRIATCDTLQSVSLHGTAISAEATRELAKLKNLHTLSFFGTHVENGAIKELTDLAKLQLLNVFSSGLTDAACDELASLTSLQTLYAGGDKAITDVGAKKLTRLSELQLLDLTLATITDASLRSFGNLPLLHTLNLSMTKVTDDGLKELVPLKRLQVLQLAHTEVSDSGIATLVLITSLTKVHLGSTRVTMEGMKKLAALPSLGFLKVDADQLSDVELEELRNALPKCKISFSNDSCWQ